MSTNTTPASVAIACNLNAIPAAEREQHEEAVHKVFAAILEVNELPNGYTFRLPLDSGILMKAAEFIAKERLCCPFFEFTLQVTPNGGPIWLQLTGDQSVKAFISGVVMGLVNPNVLVNAQ